MPRLLVRTTEYKRDYEEEQGQGQRGNAKSTAATLGRPPAPASA